MKKIRCVAILSLIALAVVGWRNGVRSNSVSHVMAEVDSSSVQAAKQASPVVSGWRRTESGWVQTDQWVTSSSSTNESRATQLHPALIAAFVILVSLGGLLAFDPLIHRRPKRWLKSDRVLLRDWGRQLRESMDHCDDL